MPSIGALIPPQKSASAHSKMLSRMEWDSVRIDLAYIDGRRAAFVLPI